MKLIKLTKGQHAKVSDHRYEELNKHKWYAEWSEKTQSYYAVRTAWPRQRVNMSRQIANTPKGMECDHINRDTLDNQDHNLRNVTHAQNNWNRKVRSDSSLGVKGVSPHGSGYRAEITVNGRRIKKTYRTLEDAIEARAAMVREHHGEFAPQ